jgi:type VI secretion system secreted protein VgrG
MREDQHVVMTLAIADCPDDLQVIGVHGQDRLNAPFRFDVDLVSPDPALDCAGLLHRNAWLTMGAGANETDGLQGEVFALRQLHRGPELSLYRLCLMPSVQRLAGRVRRRTYNGMSVPQILANLLHDHRLHEEAFRFEQLIGLYPPRKHCVQYDESDLHLLRRLCEEEGIGFRFEHHRDRHALVFSDDPAGFPEWPFAIAVDHLAEQLSMRNCYSSHAGEFYAPAFSSVSLAQQYADNQSIWAQSVADEPPGRQRQVSERELQRLRCERREIIGRSRHCSLRSGQVVRVEGHTDPLLNDQWLLTQVQHSAKQLAPLRHCSTANVVQILQAIATANQSPLAVASLHPQRARFDKPVLASYENRFLVLPWTMPFRPAQESPRPTFTGVFSAIQTHDEADAHGRLKIRYDWQSESPAFGGEDSWAPVFASVGKQPAGSRLQVRFFEGDPDQPVICGVLDDAPIATQLNRTLQLDGVVHEPGGSLLQLRPDEQLRIDSHTPLILQTSRATLSISDTGIHYTPLNTAHSPVENETGDEPLDDLQLTHPGDTQLPLANCTWYIVRMPTPDLALLARIGAEDILFEGKTDTEGWLGLSPAQCVRLLQLYTRHGEQLCLVHPGHCRPLRSVFRRSPLPAEKRA